jgi:HEAT repeat protein
MREMCSNTIDELIEKIGDSCKRTRGKAEKEIILIGNSAVGPLIHALENDNFVVRCRAARALGKTRDIRAIEPLIQKLTDCEQVQMRAAVSLKQIGKPALKALIQALGDSNYKIREGAVIALSGIRYPEVIEPLINSLQDEFSSVRWRAAYELGRTGNTKVIQPLIRAFCDQDCEVRYAASLSLLKFGKKAEAQLLKVLQDTDSEIRYCALCALEDIENIGVIEPFILELNDEYSGIRGKAALILGNSGDVRAVKPLIKALKDQSIIVRRYAAEALGKLEDHSSVEPLLNAFQDNKDDLREVIAISIAKLRDPKIGQILQKMKLGFGMIHNGLSRARENKRFSLFIEPLKKALREGNEISRIASALALGVIGGATPVEPLAESLGSDISEDVRVAAVESLGQIGRVEAKRVLKKALNDISPRVKQKAIEELAFLDIGAVKPLLQTLKDEDKGTRWKAAEDLGYLGGGNARAEKIIRNALLNFDGDIKEEDAHILEIMEEEKERVAMLNADAEAWKL